MWSLELEHRFVDIYITFIMIMAGGFVFSDQVVAICTRTFRFWIRNLHRYETTAVKPYWASFMWNSVCAVDSRFGWKKIFVDSLMLLLRFYVWWKSFYKKQCYGFDKIPSLRTVFFFFNQTNLTRIANIFSAKNSIFQTKL